MEMMGWGLGFRVDCCPRLGGEVGCLRGEDIWLGGGE